MIDKKICKRYDLTKVIKILTQVKEKGKWEEVCLIKHTLVT